MLCWWCTAHTTLKMKRWLRKERFKNCRGGGSRTAIPCKSWSRLALPAGRWCLHVTHGHRNMGPVRRSSWFGLCILPFWIWKETTDAVKVQTSKFNSRPWAEISLETDFIQSLFVAFESHDKEVAASSRPVIPELSFQLGCESNYSRESALWAHDD